MAFVRSVVLVIVLLNLVCRVASNASCTSSNIKACILSLIERPNPSDKFQSVCENVKLGIQCFWMLRIQCGEKMWNQKYNEMSKQGIDFNFDVQANYCDYVIRANETCGVEKLRVEFNATVKQCRAVDQTLTFVKPFFLDIERKCKEKPFLVGTKTTTSALNKWMEACNNGHSNNGHSILAESHNVMTMVVISSAFFLALTSGLRL